MGKKKNNNSFEDAFARLEEIAGLLDSDSIGLDEAVSLYEEGIELSKSCYEKLKEAELKITTLKKDVEGGLTEESFEE